MSDPNSVRDRYLQAWNEGDANARLDLLRRDWSADARYTDPMMAGEKPDGISDMIGVARDAFPGQAFSPRGTVDAFGSFLRFSWSLSAASDPVARGTDIVRLDADGRIAEVIGFLDAS